MNISTYADWPGTTVCVVGFNDSMLNAEVVGAFSFVVIDGRLRAWG